MHDRSVLAARALDAMSKGSKRTAYLLWMSLMAKGCARCRAASLSGAETFASCRAISPSKTYCLCGTANAPVRSLRVRRGSSRAPHLPCFSKVCVNCR